MSLVWSIRPSHRTTRDIPRELRPAVTRAQLAQLRREGVEWTALAERFCRSAMSLKAILYGSKPEPGRRADRR